MAEQNIFHLMPRDEICGLTATAERTRTERHSALRCSPYQLQRQGSAASGSITTQTTDINRSDPDLAESPNIAGRHSMPCNSTTYTTAA